MNPEELLSILARGESDRLEVTTATRDTDKFSEAVCAFANDFPHHRAPGILAIGIGQDLKPSGLVASDELLRTLADLRSSGNIQPLPPMSVEKVVFPEGEVAVVTVQPSDLPPVRYKGRVCIRIGPRRGYASEQEERILVDRRISQARTFDARPCLDSALEDLSLGLFLNDYRSHALAPEIIEENHRDVAAQLASLRFFDLKHHCPTNAGILLFGQDVRRWLPGAYVQFLRIDGTAMSDDAIINDREVSGDLLSVLRELDLLIGALVNESPEAESSLRERLRADFPRVAIRELLLNALVHRSYESTAPVRFTWFRDRIEIQSPGSLYGDASPENFPDQTSYRNPVLAEALKALGYVNRYGRGVLRAKDALARNGNPDLAYRFDAGYVLAIIPARP